MALVYFQMEGRPSRLHHVCQGGYVLLYYIDFEGGERDFFCDCVDELGEGGSEK